MQFAVFFNGRVELEMKIAGEYDKGDDKSQYK